MLVDHVMVGAWNGAGPDRRLDPDVDTGDLGADEGAAGNAVIFYHEIYGQQLAVSSSWQLAERTIRIYTCTCIYTPRGRSKYKNQHNPVAHPMSSNHWLSLAGWPPPLYITTSPNILYIFGILAEWIILIGIDKSWFI